jgi:hypothetical protein
MSSQHRYNKSSILKNLKNHGGRLSSTKNQGLDGIAKDRKDILTPPDNVIGIDAPLEIL